MTCLRNPFLVSILLVLMLGCLTVSGAETKEKDQKPFVDLDGDGFNDNADDTDSDGIPDRFERAAPRIVTKAPRSDIFAALKQSSPAAAVAVSPLERFALRQFACRAQSKCRSNFESEFTAGLGVKAGSSGGHCVGGVCF